MQEENTLDEPSIAEANAADEASLEVVEGSVGEDADGTSVVSWAGSNVLSAASWAVGAAAGKVAGLAAGRGDERLEETVAAAASTNTTVAAAASNNTTVAAGDSTEDTMLVVATPTGAAAESQMEVVAGMVADGLRWSAPVVRDVIVGAGDVLDKVGRDALLPAAKHVTDKCAEPVKVEHTYTQAHK